MSEATATEVQAQLPDMPEAEAEQNYFVLARAAAETVDRWLTDGGLDRDWYELVRGGRSRDGSLRAHPSLIAEIEAMTGIRAEHELVPFLTDDEIVAVVSAKAMATRFERLDDWPDEERVRIVRDIWESLGETLMGGGPSGDPEEIVANVVAKTGIAKEE
jgi:hypothetical protein